MHRFYAPGFQHDREIALPEDEAHHVARVLRLKAGERVVIFDGHGGEAVAVIQAVERQNVIVKAVEARVSAGEPAISLTLAQAMLKHDKMEQVIRDAVMLGVTAIQPFFSARTDVPRAAVRDGGRQERWDRTVLSSVKQCGRAVLPVVHPAITFDELLEAERQALALMFVEPSAAGSECVPLESLETRVPAQATLLIGPEGGWDPQEIRAAVTAGVTLVSMGSRVLRADIAGALAISVLQYVWKDL